ncbi:hypothetical protein CHH28_13320 [Bacterioplanes sanyensis]|uniref:Tyr recombinase domain-containing protein n=1 Tax=Bacterioplanes sanyensis TaxID=1249553 RepID=A0A222FLD4_9GAMM|nr:site-specific integrase [Bacterioplanes sanyensis]ASP39590.1 hypothetical protein CHH28_13320 [Bacterioplanes sanyensis]
MKKNSNYSSYLTRNQVGTYVFQIRVPTHILRQNHSLKPIFRCSLGTKSLREAICRSGVKLSLFEEILKGYDCPKLFEQQLIALRNRADFSSQKSQLDSGSHAPLLPSSVGATSTVVDIALDELVESFLLYKADSGVRSASYTWYERKLSLFVQIARSLAQKRNLMLSDLTANLVRRYATIMGRYPKYARNQVETKLQTVDELVAVIEQHSRESLVNMGYNLIGYQTMTHYFTAVKELLRYAQRQQFNVPNGLADLLHAPKKRRGVKPQVKFDSTDLKRIFMSHEYLNGSFKRNSDYWIPLLALFGGQTQAELCQLHVSDVRQQEGIWYIDINDQDDKNLKNETGRPRQVPIHRKLIELGFLAFVEHCRKSGQTRLFPEEKKNEYDKYSSYSKRFNRWRQRLGVTVDSAGGRKTFHSFRHLVSDWLIGNQCHPGVAADIIGHEGRERMETRRTYSDGAWLAEKNKWIQSISYELDLSEIRHWSPGCFQSS